ncbi:MAG: transglycosylase SLT domain-containing protein [Alphaproteobacteria bacterium]|nr:transglycosylase SLT domain-containing protein [Alphaproteobacteria bacterium]
MLTVAIAAGLTMMSPRDSAAKSPETHEICAHAIDRAEAGRTLPRELLTAISRVESGRWNDKEREVLAWPWTVTNGADGQYFPTKKAAIAHVRKLQARGIRNIDVGCMQINLRYHPDAFDNLEQALDPVENAQYAADFLSRLFVERRSWGEAIKRYHSANPKFNRPYYDKVVRQWDDARKDASTYQLARLTDPKGLGHSRERVERAPDDPRRLAAEAHRQAVIAKHRAERQRLRAEREAQLASFADGFRPDIQPR